MSDQMQNLKSDLMSDVLLYVKSDFTSLSSSSWSWELFVEEVLATWWRWMIADYQRGQLVFLHRDDHDDGDRDDGDHDDTHCNNHQIITINHHMITKEANLFSCIVVMMMIVIIIMMIMIISSWFWSYLIAKMPLANI